jgi:hypothetical protein
MEVGMKVVVEMKVVAVGMKVVAVVGLHLLEKRYYLLMKNLNLKQYYLILL